MRRFNKRSIKRHIVRRKYILLMDAAELAIAKIEKGKRSSRINGSSLYRELIELKPWSYKNLYYSEFRNIMYLLFPLYKNGRMKVKKIKVNTSIAYEIFRDAELNLRELNHIRIKREMGAKTEDKEL